MDQEKIWMNRQDLEAKVKDLQQKLLEQEIRFSLLESVEKMKSVEKDLLEIRLNQVKSEDFSIFKEMQIVSQELLEKNSVIQIMENRLETLTREKNQENWKVLKENELLKNQVLILQDSQEKMRKSNLKINEKFVKCQEITEKIESCQSFSCEFYEKVIREKEEMIKKMIDEVSEVRAQLELLKQESFVDDKEKIDFFKKIWKLSHYQREQVLKIIDGKDLYQESNEKLKTLMKEYEKKIPFILKQKKNYEQLIKDHEDLKFNYSKLKSELETTQLSLNSLKEEMKDLDSLKEQNSYLSNQLVQILSNSSQGSSSDYSSIKTLVFEVIDYGLVFAQQEALISQLESENKDLRSRPVIIEEHIPGPEVEKLLFLEAFYQKNKENTEALLNQIKNLDIENSELKGKLEFALKNEENLKNLIKSAKSQKQTEKILTPPVVLTPFPFDLLKESQKMQNSCIEEYKKELIRLQNENFSMIELLEDNKTRLFQSIQSSDLKLEKLLHEKSAIFCECQKLKSKILEMEKIIKSQDEKLSKAENELKKPKIEPKEFAAVNELHECRTKLIQTEEKFLEIQKECEKLRLENKIIHEKLETVARKSKNNELVAKVNELVQENYLVKSTVELLQERMKKVVASNLQLEDQNRKLHQELNQKVISSQDIGGQELLLSAESQTLEDPQVSQVLREFQQKVNDLIKENQNKDSQITYLMTVLSEKQSLPDILGKIVSALHKISKT